MFSTTPHTRPDGQPPVKHRLPVLSLTDLFALYSLRGRSRCAVWLAGGRRRAFCSRMRCGAGAWAVQCKESTGCSGAALPPGGLVQRRLTARKKSEQSRCRRDRAHVAEWRTRDEGHAWRRLCLRATLTGQSATCLAQRGGLAPSLWRTPLRTATLADMLLNQARRAHSWQSGTTHLKPFSDTLILRRTPTAAAAACSRIMLPL
jgi:hypothetical protein